jgi:hypothetical protein
MAAGAFAGIAVRGLIGHMAIDLFADIGSD